MPAESSVVTTALPSIDQVVAEFTASQNAAPAPSSAGNEALQAALDDKSNRAPAPQVAETTEEITETSTEEPAPEAPAPAAKAERDPTAAKFAAIARKEREMRDRVKQFEDRQKAIDARDNDIKAREAKLAAVKSSPLKNLKELGVSWQDIIADSVGNYREPVIDPTEQRFMSVEEKLAKVEQLERQVNEKFQMLEQREVQAAIKEVDDNIVATAQDEKYEFIQAVGTEAYSLVKEVMAEYFHTNQKLLDYNEACDIVEQYYEKEYVSKFLNTKKVKARAATTSTPAAAPTKPVTPRKEAKETASTLTQSHKTATQATIDVDKMPRNEAIAHLAKQLRFRE